MRSSIIVFWIANLFACTLVTKVFCESSTNLTESTLSSQNQSMVISVSSSFSISSSVSRVSAHTLWPRKINRYCVCGSQNEKLKGTPFPQPWIVGITRSSAAEIACSGVLISDRYVLTTAHCARLTTGESQIIIPSDVVNSTLNTTNDSTKDDDETEPFFTALPISDVRINPKFVSQLADTSSFELRNDIALIRLAERLQLNSTTSRAATICLPDQPVKQAFHEHVHIVGYAALGRQANPSDRFLWHREASLLSSSECKQVWQQLYRKGRNLCTQSRLNGLCDGGLGSSLSVQRYGKQVLLGMLSVASRLCARSSVPDMFVDVRPYMSWIYRNTVDSAYCQQSADFV